MRIDDFREQTQVDERGKTRESRCWENVQQFTKKNTHKDLSRLGQKTNHNLIVETEIERLS